MMLMTMLTMIQIMMIMMMRATVDMMKITLNMMTITMLTVMNHIMILKRTRTQPFREGVTDATKPSI